jgi:hypothetical protein
MVVVACGLGVVTCDLGVVACKGLGDIVGIEGNCILEELSLSEDDDVDGAVQETPSISRKLHEDTQSTTPAAPMATLSARSSTFEIM